MTKDPVCGRQINESTVTTRGNYQGRDYQFCSQDCKRQFDQHPERYAQQQTQSAASQRSERGAA
jgi:YHS domain-containing protein